MEKEKKKYAIVASVLVVVGLIVLGFHYTLLDSSESDDSNEIDDSDDPSGSDEEIIHSYLPTHREAETREQIYDRSEEFQKLDLDNDGFLTSTEYGGTQKLFEDIDTNGDGKLSPEESKYMITFAEIPSGTFTMGSNEPIMAFSQPTTDSMPAHQVKVDGFKMSATEITTAQYALYLNSALKAGEITVSLGNVSDMETRVFYPVPAYIIQGAPGTKYAGKVYIELSLITGLSHVEAHDSPLLIPMHPLNQAWIDYIPETESFYVHPGFEDWPAAFVKWWGAIAFAEYYDLSLPTEAEWEYAASGGEQFKFATGDGTNSGDRANYACYNVMQIPNFNGADEPDNYVGFRMKVGSYLPNPYGVYDLAGNVWEWTLDWYREDFYQYLLENGITSNPVNLVGDDPPYNAKGGPGQEFSHDAKVCRGGSYNYHEPLTQTASRFPVYPFIANDHFGARVMLRSSTVTFNGNE